MGECRHNNTRKTLSAAAAVSRHTHTITQHACESCQFDAGYAAFNFVCLRTFMAIMPYGGDASSRYATAAAADVTIDAFLIIAMQRWRRWRRWQLLAASSSWLAPAAAVAAGSSTRHRSRRVAAWKALKLQQRLQLGCHGREAVDAHDHRQADVELAGRPRS